MASYSEDGGTGMGCTVRLPGAGPVPWASCGQWDGTGASSGLASCAHQGPGSRPCELSRRGWVLEPRVPRAL